MHVPEENNYFKAYREMISHHEYKPVQIEDDLLQCPRCKELYLHHCGISLYDREEDADYVMKTYVPVKFDGWTPKKSEKNSVDLAVSHIKAEASGNPSDRRGGVVIHFFCECCGDGIDLTIAQSKGHSWVEWRLNMRDP